LHPSGCAGTVHCYKFGHCKRIELCFKTLNCGRNYNYAEEGRKLKRIFSGTMLMLLLVGTLTLAFNIQPVKAEPKTWTVDDDGPADFHTIQEAINAANSGDTVFAYNGTYYEHLTVGKLLTLIGQNQSNTVIDGSNTGAAVIVTASNVTISGFTIQHAGSPPYGKGIYLSYTSHNVTISGNTVRSNTWGIWADDGSGHLISDNRILNNTDRGVYLNFNNNSTISGNLITNSGSGIELSDCKHINVTENRITDSWIGIRTYGIETFYSRNNVIRNNILSSNSYGISLSFSTNDVLRNNTLTGNAYSFEVQGWSPSEYIHDIDTSNTINGKPIYYWVNQKNRQVPYNAGYVGAVNCENITVRGQNLSNSGQGVMFAYTMSSIVEDTNMSNNYDGIYLIYSSNNLITHNNFIDNEYQVWSYYSTNTWDYGYPYGNYWSDYKGADLNNDGVGDIPYVIDNDNRDRYPSMEPWILTLPAEYDLITSMIAPTFQRLGGSSNIDAIVRNRGLNDEVNVQLSLLINGSVVKSTTVPLLDVGSSYNFSYLWTPVWKGTYNITVYSPPKPGETLTDNNIVTLFVNVASVIRVPDYIPTIQMAIEIANPGDTISVAPGTYYENIQVTKDSLSLIGSGADVTVIDGQGKNNVIYKPLEFSVNTFTIEGFTIRNSSHSGSIPGSAGIHIDGSGTFIISMNKIQDNGVGIAIWNHWGPVVIVENNVIANNDWDAIEGYCGEMIIRSNTIAYNGGSGYSDDGGPGTRYFTNNIIVSNGLYGIAPSGSTPRYIEYNNVWNNSRGDYYNDSTYPFVPSPGTGEISADPLFIDAANRDYHLSESSPCIDAGTNGNAPTTDCDGKPRPIDGNRDGTAIVDMGAYEYNLPPTPTYSIVITAVLSGTTNPAPGIYTYPGNSQLQVTAIPNSGYLFDHWELDSVNAGSANPHAVLMEKNHVLKAVFTPTPPLVGGSSIPVQAPIKVGPAFIYIAMVATLTAIFTKLGPKTRRKH
jgi:parallel beta-helix repeat protein